MNEATSKRGRGRPKGRSARYASDEKVLEAMADAILKDPKSNPTRAARQLGNTSEAAIYRLRRQFKSRQNELLASAQKRRDSHTTRPVSRGGGTGRDAFGYGYVGTSFVDQMMRHTQTGTSLLEREVSQLDKVRDMIHEQTFGPSSAVKDVMLEWDRQMKDAFATAGLDSVTYRANDAVSQFLRREEEMNRYLYGPYGRNRPWSGY